MTSVSQRACYQLRRDIAEKIDRMPMGYFERTSTGDVLSRITNDVDTLGMSLNQGLTQLVTSITTIVGVLAMMLSINVVMTLVTLVVLPIAALLVKVIVKRSQKYFFQQQETLGLINGQVEETFSGHAVVRAFNQEERAIKNFERDNERLYESAWKSQFLSGLMQPAMNFVGNLGYVAVAVLGSFFAVQSVIAGGDIQAFIQYVKNFTQPITQLAQVSNVLQMMAAAAERIFAFLDEPEVHDRAATATTAGIACDVEFDHVRFGYAADKPVIHDFSACVREGQTVALVGPTGAGKTTMVKLLMLLRRGRRRHPRGRSWITRPRRSALAFRHGASGHLAVQGHHPREHPLRKASTRPTKGGRGGKGGVRAPFHHDRCRTATTRASTRMRAM